MASEMSVAPTGTVNNATRYQRIGTRQRALRRARSTTPSRPAGVAVTKKAPTPAEQPSHESVQWQAVRQDLRIRDRPDSRGQEACAETNHHERHHWLACDDAEQSRHQCILSLPGLLSQSWSSTGRS